MQHFYKLWQEVTAPGQQRVRRIRGTYDVYVFALQFLYSLDRSSVLMNEFHGQIKPGQLFPPVLRLYAKLITVSWLHFGFEPTDLGVVENKKAHKYRKPII